MPIAATTIGCSRTHKQRQSTRQPVSICCECPDRNSVCSDFVQNGDSSRRRAWQSSTRIGPDIDSLPPLNLLVGLLTVTCARACCVVLHIHLHPCGIYWIYCVSSQVVPPMPEDVSDTRGTWNVSLIESH